MSRSPWVAWILLPVWTAWLYGLQGLFAQTTHLGSWTPDLGLVLFLALAARVPREDLPALGLSVALGRCALSVDPPAAILAAFLGAGLLCGAARSVVDLGSGLLRGGFGALLAAGVAGWLGWVHRVRHLEASAAWGVAWSPDAPGAEPALLRLALATGLASFVAGPLLARLPGLTPLRKKKPWPLADSRR